jgi:dephospho-CoA kinase
VPAIGITGGVSTGKSSFTECLRKILPGARFFNADTAARELADTDPDVRKEIQGHFGADIYSKTGDLNRARLRAIILQSASDKIALEQILHPRIRRQWSAEAQSYSSSRDFFFADIPLLYETGGETLCDGVVVVACSPEIQLQRLLSRGRAATLARDEALQLIQSQMPLEEKIKRADHVVWNNGGREVLAQQADYLVRLWQDKQWKRK